MRAARTALHFIGRDCLGANNAKCFLCSSSEVRDWTLNPKVHFT